MNYYSEKIWWNPEYKIRRSVSLTPFDLLPGSETLCCAKLKKTEINGKIKPDYSDLNVIYQGDNDTSYLLPHYVVDEGDWVSVVFEAVTSIAYTNPATPSQATPYTYIPLLVDGATPDLFTGSTPKHTYVLPEVDVPASEYEYFFYYAGKTGHQTNDDLDVLDRDYLTDLDYGQLGDLTRWTFQRPTVSWSQNLSMEPDARATFEFVGHRADLYFRVGPSFGKFEYWIGNGERTVVDCYAAEEAVSRVAVIDTGKIESTKLRIRSLGDRHLSSTADNVKLEYLAYNQTLIGTVEGREEFYSSIGKAITTGA